MLQVLLESGAHVERRTGWTLASLMTHAGLITTAVAITMRAGSPSPAVATSAPPDVHYIAPVPVEQADVATGVVARGVLELLPSRPDVALPILPSLDLASSARDAIVSGNLFGDPGLVGPIGVTTTTPSDGVHSDRAVDRAVIPAADNGQPPYPAMLRSAGVEGGVLVRFVVDSAGRVEPRSLIILSETHQLFGDAVRRWLDRTRYAPAMLAGRRVRQLVEQRINFSLAGRSMPR